MKLFSPTVLALALIAATACSRAEEPVAKAGKPRPDVIKTIEARGLEVFGEFDAPGGLRGFAGLAGQRPMAVYVTPDGQHAVVGMLIDAKETLNNSATLRDNAASLPG